MLHVCLNSYAESLFRSFHEVTTATTMNVHFNTARYYNATFGIDSFCAFNV